MNLRELSSHFVNSRIIGHPETEFTGAELDSRKAAPGSLFICLRGHTVDGHDYAAKAAENGAAALVVEEPVDVDLPMLVVPDSRYAMAVIANLIYRNPSERLRLIGVTGTNGKTTITHLIDKILTDQQHKTGLIGTIRNKIIDVYEETKNTTPEALDLQRLFHRMVESGANYCIMEVSSHALELGRVKGCSFQTAVFTNLTQDHLDFHKSMESYREAKGLLFSRMGNTFSADPSGRKIAVLNADDEASKHYARITSAQVITYGIDLPADVRATNLRITPRGTSFQLKSFAGEMDFDLQLIGKFSVYNALAAIATTLAEGVSLASIKNSLEEVTGVDGRFEAVQAGQPFLAVVDYAHTPDSLDNVLRTIREFAEGRVICVFGCGGDRDRTKRPIMGKVAARYSDVVIVTSDNPRSEQPEAILRDIEQGLLERPPHNPDYFMIEDRRKAIHQAVQMAGPGDVLLVAGKGHETYQEIQGVRTDFDDREVIKEAVQKLCKP